MAKQTILEIVKKILSTTDGDLVNSINDTEEAYQAAECVQSSYEYLVETLDLPSENRLIQLTALADLTKPTHMRFPTAVRIIEWVKYNKEDTPGEAQWREVIFLEPTEFYETLAVRDETSSIVKSVTDFGGVELLVYNDRHPTYWTTFDEENIVFDSYNQDVDSTLQQSKTSCFGLVEKVFTLSDDFIPDLPSKFFNMLVEESKAEFSANYKEGNRRAETKSRRQQIKYQQDKHREKKEKGYYAFGRR